VVKDTVLPTKLTLSIVHGNNDVVGELVGEYVGKLVAADGAIDRDTGEFVPGQYFAPDITLRSGCISVVAFSSLRLQRVVAVLYEK